MSAIQSIRGFADLFSPESDAFTFLEANAREVFGRFGYSELRTPLVEYTDLFCRSIGTETDVVQKEMYSFPDSKGRSLSLRPEATAGVMRAYIQANRHGQETVSKLFTTGPMFRHERPQAGRMRQFHQLNCECLGAEGAATDAEMIVMLTRFLAQVGIVETELHINSLGCPVCRPRHREALLAFLQQLDAHQLCEDCRRRMHTNPLRVLDCKVPTCRELTDKAPRILDHACPECERHFATVLELTGAAGVGHVLDHRLVRGLDYYCRTTFEVVSGKVGAQSSIAGGGRYDGLVRQLGGPAVPGVGFACGMERLAMLLPCRERPRPDFYIATMGEAAQGEAFHLACALRAEGLAGDFSHTGGGFKGQMRQAGKSNARFCCILGEDEVTAGTVVVKNMDKGTQITVARNAAAQAMRRK